MNCIVEQRIGTIHFCKTLLSTYPERILNLFSEKIIPIKIEAVVESQLETYKLTCFSPLFSTNFPYLGIAPQYTPGYDKEQKKITMDNWCNAFNYYGRTKTNFISQNRIGQINIPLNFLKELTPEGLEIYFRGLIPIDVKFNSLYQILNITCYSKLFNTLPIIKLFDNKQLEPPYYIFNYNLNKKQKKLATTKVMNNWQETWEPLCIKR